MRAALLLALIAGPALAQPAAPVAKPLAALEATLSGQPIDPPAGPLKITVTESIYPAGGRIAPHKHPYPRLVQILEGRFPERVILKAVERMLPGGPLSRKQMGNLRVYGGAEHPHGAQNPEVLDLAGMNPKNTRSA